MGSIQDACILSQKIDGKNKIGLILAGKMIGQIKLLTSRNIAVFLLLIICMYEIFYRPMINVSGRRLSCYVVLIAIDFVYIFYNYNFRSFFNYIKTFKSEIISLCILLFVVFLRTIVGGDSGILIGKAKTFLLLSLNTFLIVDLIKKYFWEQDSFIRLTLVVGTIAASISTVCIINEDFNYYIKNVVQFYDEDLKQSDYLFRCFGLSSVLLFDYGIIQGIILSLGVLNIKNNKWFAFVLPLMILSIILNARTGLLISIICVLTYSFFSIKYRSLLWTVLSVLIAFLGFLWLLPQLNLAGGSESFIMEFYNDIVNVFQTGNMSESETYNHLTAGNPWPQSFEEWLFGIGKDIMYVHGRSSDIGYLGQLNYGGLLYFIPLYAFIFQMFKKWKKINKAEAYLFLIALLVTNIKGDFLGTTFFDFLFIFYVYRVMSNQTKKICIQRSHLSPSLQ